MSFKRYLIVLFHLSVLTFLHASGWHDYKLSIDDGYGVFRANTLDISIGIKGGGLILFPRDYAGVGPVQSYYVSPEYILVKNAGRHPRNFFEGDTGEEIDYGKEYFFIIRKSDDQVMGPYSAEEFKQETERINLYNISWIKPKNPNFWRPFLGDLIFISIALPILAIKFFYITIPIVVLVVWWILKVVRSRKNITQ